MRTLTAARRLHLRVPCPYVCSATYRNPVTVRSYSSSHNRNSSSPNNKNNNNNQSPRQLETGYDFATGTWHRCTSRLSTLSTYQDQNIFVNSLSTLAQYWLFFQLQLPQKTEVNLLEFVEGATVASEATLRAMNCDAFPKFLAGNETCPSEVNEQVQQYTTPAYYNQMALQVKRNYVHRNFYIECEKMNLERAQVARVVYRRLTETEYLDLVNFRRSRSKLSPEASIEHLSIHIDIATVEDLKVVHREQKPRHVQHQNVYRVAFESRVTEQDDVDWRIANMHIIEQLVLPRSPTCG